ncbi:MAG: helix-turn-helix transcriptional regulator [Alphaproteobacteria bacterium]|nr:MAG: helix-turn-helix transcriptional regulator [Alphaproteobacteria bacterium]
MSVYVIAEKTQNCAPPTRHYNTKLKDQCAPLIQKMGVDLFMYRKLSQNESDLYFCSNELFDSLPLDSHLPNSETFWRELSHSSLLNRYYYYLWDTDAHLSDAYYNYFYTKGIWNGLNIYRRNMRGVEMFTFGMKSSANIDPNFYLNNLGHFLHFLSYFQAKISRSNHYTSRHKCAFGDLFQKIFLNYDKTTCVPSNQNMGELRIVLATVLGDVTLSKRESECLRLLSLGKTAKEIGRTLDLSHRTVESYISNIRQKTALNSRSDLVEAYQRAVPPHTHIGN